MVIKIYIFTIIFCMLAFISLVHRYIDYAIIKKEGTKVGKIEAVLLSIESIINLRVLLIFLIPIFNIIFALFCIFATDNILDDVHRKCNEVFKEDN